ncbi:hypothetical protein AA0X95_04280 [Bacillus sp. 1P10SD]|uniref:hypothetical protein n=1 Tax=Bacillus sp. 1P10SD TaxID=3132265 RepID=UPI0039A73EA5
MLKEKDKAFTLVLRLQLDMDILSTDRGLILYECLKFLLLVMIDSVHSAISSADLLIYL